MVSAACDKINGCVCVCVCAAGMVGNIALGKVYAPDPDDWDNKTYTLETSAAK